MAQIGLIKDLSTSYYIKQGRKTLFSKGFYVMSNINVLTLLYQCERKGVNGDILLCPTVQCIVIVLNRI